MSGSHKEGDYSGRDRPLESERQRLEHMAAAMNPGTQRVIREIGLLRGGRCLEIGAAEGSMARWLAEQVGSEGFVVAADLDTRFLAELALPNVEVRELDVRNADLGSSSFDLAYCRTLLMHLPDPNAALIKMRDALRPGGALLAQEPDTCVNAAADPDHPEASRFEGVHHAMYDWLRESRIFDPYLGRTLAPRFEAIGLEQVETRAEASVEQGGSASAETQRRTLEALTPMLVKAGAVEADDLQCVQELFADPGFRYLSGLRVMTWGRVA